MPLSPTPPPPLGDEAVAVTMAEGSREAGDEAAVEASTPEETAVAVIAVAECRLLRTDPKGTTPPPPAPLLPSEIEEEEAS